MTPSVLHAVQAAPGPSLGQLNTARAAPRAGRTCSAAAARPRRRSKAHVKRTSQKPLRRGVLSDAVHPMSWRRGAGGALCFRARRAHQRQPGDTPPATGCGRPAAAGGAAARAWRGRTMAFHLDTRHRRRCLSASARAGVDRRDWPAALPPCTACGPNSLLASRWRAARLRARRLRPRGAPAAAAAHIGRASMASHGAGGMYCWPHTCATDSAGGLLVQARGRVMAPASMTSPAAWRRPPPPQQGCPAATRPAAMGARWI